MQPINARLPLPFIKMNKMGKILEYSHLAEEMFDIRSRNFIDIMDVESIRKLFTMTADEDGLFRLEVNLITNLGQIALFDIHMTPDEEGNANMILAPKERSNQKVLEKMEMLQQRVASTDFELFEQKEKMEQIIEKLNALSGPFLTLTEKIGYIPIFGDITPEKIFIIAENSLHTIFSGEYDEILVDLTAVGELPDNGLQKFTDFLKAVQLMTGNNITLIGIKPEQAERLNEYPLDGLVKFEHSLKTILEKLLKVRNL
ncbi:MAG: Stressosome protein rsbRB [Bacillus sp. (in: firmicutes)]